MNQKAYLLGFLIIILTVNLLAQDPDPSLVKRSRVKEIREIAYKVIKGRNDNPEVVGYKIYNTDGALNEEYSKFTPAKYRYEYNSAGLLIRKVELDDKNDRKVDRTWDYQYDTKGNLTRETTYWTEFEGTDPDVFAYNEYNQLVTVSSLNHKNEVYKRTSHKYFQTGELYETEYWEKYNKSAYRIKRFDKCGNLIYSYGNMEEAKAYYDFLILCTDLSQDKNYRIDTIKSINGGKTYTDLILYDSTRKSIYRYDSANSLRSLSTYQYNIHTDEVNRSEEKSYNEKGQLVQLKTLYHWKVDNYATDVNLSKTNKTFTYYENGLLKKVSELDDQLQVIRVTEYVVDYY